MAVKSTNRPKAEMHKGEQELIGVFSWMIANKGNWMAANLADGKQVVGDPTGVNFTIGTTYRFFGRWVDHPKFGKQFKFTTVVQDTPLNEDGIVKYLVDNVDGIGFTRARELFAKYKDKTVDTLADRPHLVVKDGLLSKEIASKASKLLSTMVATRQTTIDLLGIFARRGFRKKLVQHCIYRWGTAAAERVRSNPYNLIIEKLPGCGFKNVDKLYLDLGGDPSSLQRQMFCAWHALKVDMTGSTWFSVKYVAHAISEAIAGASLNFPEAIREGIKGKWLALWNKNSDIENKKGWVSEFKKAEEEKCFADQVKRLLSSSKVEWPTTFLGLSDHQEEQARKATAMQIAILAGTPGTGKTFTAGAIIKAVIAKWGVGCIAACAPTGRAAVRLTQSMRKSDIHDLQATTIHRLLKMGVNDEGETDFEFGVGKRLPHRFIIVDEVSMCGVGLLSRLLSALSEGTHILFIGDKYQLPPIEHGAPYRDLLKFIECGELTEIWRNSGDIVGSCKNMKEGKPILFSKKFDEKKGHNLRLIRTSSAEEQVDCLYQFFKAAIGSGIDVFDDVQVITPLNDKSPCSRKILNPIVQNWLNQDTYRVDGCKFRFGDKAVCTRNSWLWSVRPSSSKDSTEFQVIRDEKGDPKLEYVANGEIGRVVAINKQSIIVHFKEPSRLVRVGLFNNEDADEDGSSSEPVIDLAYLVTGHKMQGSQAKFVVILVDSYPGARYVCSFEWWYCSLSRGEKRVLVIGDPDVIKRHCSRSALEDRKTFLLERLQRCSKSSSKLKSIPLAKKE